MPLQIKIFHLVDWLLVRRWWGERGGWVGGVGHSCSFSLYSKSVNVYSNGVHVYVFSRATLGDVL